MAKMGFDLTPGWNISDTVSGVENIVSPITKPIGDALGQFSDSGFGQFILQAASTGVFTALAGPFGPQLASVAFALPGMAKGDDFAKAYVTDVFRRVSLTAKILSGGQFSALGDDAVKHVTEQLSQYADKLKSLVPPDIGDQISNWLSSNASGSLADLQGQLTGFAKDNPQYVDALSKLIPGQTADTYARLLTGPIAGYAKLIPGGREDAAVLAKAALFKVIPPEDMNIDALTGKVSVLLASKLSELLGIPVQGTGSAFPYPQVGSQGYLLVDIGGYHRGELVTIQNVTYKPGPAGTAPQAIAYTVGDGPDSGNATVRSPVQVVASLLSECAPPVFPQVGSTAYLIAPTSGFVEGERVTITAVGPSIVAGQVSPFQNFYTSSFVNFSNGKKSGVGPHGILSATPITVFPGIGSSGYMMLDAPPFVKGERVVITSAPQAFPGSALAKTGVRGYAAPTKQAFVLTGSVSKSPIASGVSKTVTLNAATDANTSIGAPTSNVVKGIAIFSGGALLYGLSKMLRRA